ncbi:MAG: helix-turn-helix domain-containing protein [Pseudomonadota bacterium]
MTTLDAFFRFSGIGVLLLLASLTVMHFPKWRSAPYLVLTCISVSALFIGYAPKIFQPSGALYFVVRLLDVPHLVFVWLFALSLFTTNFRLRPLHILLGVLYCLPILWVRLDEFGWSAADPPFIGAAVSLSSIGLITHLCVTTLKGRTDDLLHKRRASRVYFVAMIALVTVVSAVSEPLIPISSEWRQTSKVLAIWPAIIWGFIWMTTFDRKAVTFMDDVSETKSLSEQDKQLREKLVHEMKECLAFRDPDLSIVSLASKIGVTQHRLRSLINKTLGHKNFSEFVNAYRIADVKTVLADRKKVHVPILTISMDSGFKSLSSFNRAFKKAEGITPTEYRTQNWES